MKSKKFLLVPIFALLLSAGAHAQTVFDSVEELDFDAPESWAMKWVTSAALQTGFGVPEALESGTVDVGFEVGWLPSLSEAERRVGFNGTKVENINRSSVFARPRVLVGLPGKFSLEVAYVPPVELDGVEPNLLSLSIGRPIHESRRLRVGLRLTALQGTVEGDITCSADEAAAGPDPARNPFFCEAPSEDELDISSYGLELSAALALPGSNLEPYLAIAAHQMDLEFQIDARWAGIVDRTLQRTDGDTWHATLGVRTTGWARSQLSAELFYTPLDVVRPPSTTVQTDELFNVRVAYRFRVR